MVKLRLSRFGSKRNPHYRIVAADVRSPRDGRFIEIVGHYNPQTDPSTIKFNKEKTLRWLAKGALPTNVVGKLLQVTGIKDEFEKDKKKYVQEGQC